LLSSDHETLTDRDDIVFSGNSIYDQKNSGRQISFDLLVKHAYLDQVSLSATGFYKTPDIHFDKEKGRGKPFHYYAFGMAVSEVLLDTLTGHHEILKTFIIQDAGHTINKLIDIGQVEGGFIQGVGWCMLNYSPDTYKIPGVRDIPDEFHVELLANAPNPDTIRNSKAVGEPPFMLAFSVWLAIKDAISAVADHRFEPDFRLPATNEVILQSVEKLRKKFSGDIELSGSDFKLNKCC